MKLLSYQRDGIASFGAVTGDAVVDLGAALPHCPTLADFIASPDFARREAIVDAHPARLPLDALTYLPVIPRPEKVVCVLRNYTDPTAGPDAPPPDYPPIFLRLWRSQVGHRAPVVRPRVSKALDFEGELAVVIGRAGRHIAEADALGHVAGYSIYNDVSVRDFQRHAGQITPGKTFADTGPFGPWMVTADEIEDPHALILRTRLNGVEVQAGSTAQLIFGVPQLIAYCSTIFELVPGDVIVTGTPAGAGFTRTPPLYMTAGDVIEVEIDKIGTLSNPIVDE